MSPLKFFTNTSDSCQQWTIFYFSVANQTVYDAFHSIIGISMYHFATAWSRYKALNSLYDSTEQAIVSKVCKTNLCTMLIFQKRFDERVIEETKYMSTGLVES